jgi:hypothetical protein
VPREEGSDARKQRDKSKKDQMVVFGHCVRFNVGLHSPETCKAVTHSLIILRVFGNILLPINRKWNEYPVTFTYS